MAEWRLRLSSALGGAGRRGRACWRRLAREAGQTLAEYALLLSAVAVAVVVSTLVLFREEIADAFSDAASCVQGNVDDDECDDD